MPRIIDPEVLVETDHELPIKYCLVFSKKQTKQKKTKENTTKQNKTKHLTQPEKQLHTSCFFSFRNRNEIAASTENSGSIR